MTRAVYSTCFLAVSSASGLTTYAVPADHTAVLHNMSLWVRYSHQAPPPEAFITVALDAVDMIVWSLDASTIRAGVYQWQGREVFTGHLYLQATATSWAFRANGYLLTPT